MPKKYDAFISHASEDKDEVVRELAQFLENSGYRIWYDEISMGLGEGLRRSIDRGILESRFGIIILSKHFFLKGWANYELDGLVQIAMDHPGLILPIWHNVNRAEVVGYSPSLANIMAISTASKTVPEIATELERKLGEYTYQVQPDLTLIRSPKRSGIKLLQREAGYQVLASLQTDQILDKDRSNSRSEIILYPYEQDYGERVFHYWQNEPGDIKLTRHIVYDVEKSSIISFGSTVEHNDGLHLISKVKFTRQSSGPLRVVCDLTSTNQFKGLFKAGYEFVEINHKHKIEHYNYTLVLPNGPEFEHIKAYSENLLMSCSRIPGAVCWSEIVRPQLAGVATKYHFVNEDISSLPISP